MNTVTALDAKNNFGELLDQAQRENVTISKHGRPVAVVMSHQAFQEHQRIRLDLLRKEVQKGIDDVKHGKVVSAEQAFAALDKELEE